MAQRTNLAYRTPRACEVSIRCGICARLCACRVLRYLKQRSIMSEGADGITDPRKLKHEDRTSPRLNPLRRSWQLSTLVSAHGSARSSQRPS